jgi:hypothetical protein
MYYWINMILAASQQKSVWITYPVGEAQLARAMALVFSFSVVIFLIILNFYINFQILTIFEKKNIFICTK